MDEYTKVKYKNLKNQLQNISLGLKKLDNIFNELNSVIEKNITFDKKNPVEESMFLIRSDINEINESVNNSIVSEINNKLYY